MIGPLYNKFFPLYQWLAFLLYLRDGLLSVMMQQSCNNVLPLLGKELAHLECHLWRISRLTPPQQNYHFLGVKYFFFKSRCFIGSPQKLIYCHVRTFPIFSSFCVLQQKVSGLMSKNVLSQTKCSDTPKKSSVINKSNNSYLVFHFLSKETVKFQSQYL